MLGFDAILYYKSGAEWVELKKARDVTVVWGRPGSDATTRGAKTAEASPGVPDPRIDFELLWDTSDAGVKAIRAALVAGDSIELAAMDGPIDTAGREGPQGGFMIEQLSRNEPLRENMTAAFVAKPIYGGDVEWVVVSGGG